MIANPPPLEAVHCPLLGDIDLTSGLSKAVRHELDRGGYLALRGVECDVSEGIARLRGCVCSYYVKQLAQHLAGSVEGIVGVSNEIKVVNPGGRPSEGRNRSD